ncbi:MAG: S41 family peptidase [Bryobacteraceae bacterium]
MRFFLCAAAGVLALPLWAQLTADQKIHDFQQMATLFAKNYAPLEWKQQLFGVDLFDIRAWSERVRAAKTDLEFGDLIYEFAATLEDGHVQPFLQSDFVAFLPIATDVYDGKVLIDDIDRRSLPAARYPFGIGSEVIAVDGVPVRELLDKYSRYSFAANPRSNRRFAADLITFRPQSLLPAAHRIGDKATVSILLEDDLIGDFEMEWVKRGTPVENFGPVPDQRFSAKAPKQAAAGQDDLFKRMSTFRLSADRPVAVSGFGSPIPYYRLPAGFRVRLGTTRGDVFVSGAYQSQGLRIGYIRIGDFDGTDEAVTQFINEVAFFEANTDGLVVDVTRNPGGNACYAELLMTLLMPRQFRTIGIEMRPTASLLAGLSRSLTSARAQGAEKYVIDLLEARYNAVESAYRESRGLTGPLPICSLSLDVQPLRLRTGEVFAYGKPMLVLTDELSASAADAFAAVMQDNGRAAIFGMRTMGLGGALFETNVPLTTFSEIRGSITGGLMVRARDIVTSEYPTAPVIENIGVRPDFYYDFMTAENLSTDGAPFVQAFTAAMVDTILGR